MALDRIARADGRVAHNVGQLAAFVEEGPALDDPLIAVRLDLFASGLPSLRVPLRRQHRDRGLTDRTHPDLIPDPRRAQRLPEGTLEVHTPDLAVAAFGLDADEVRHWLLGIVCVGCWAVIDEFSDDQRVVGRAARRRFVHLPRYRSLGLRLRRRPAAARGERAREAFTLEFGGLVAADCKSHEACREPGFLPEELRATDSDLTATGFMRDRHHALNHDGVLGTRGEPIPVMRERLRTVRKVELVADLDEALLHGIRHAPRAGRRGPRLEPFITRLRRGFTRPLPGAPLHLSRFFCGAVRGLGFAAAAGAARGKLDKVECRLAGRRLFLGRRGGRFLRRSFRPVTTDRFFRRGVGRLRHSVS